MNQISEKLLNAYKSTTYSVPELELNIRVDEQNKPLKRFLTQQKVKTWAYITAWNPESKQHSLTENRVRNQSLLAQLKLKAFSTFEGLGVPDDGDWTPEESLFILRISRKYAMQLSEQYSQNAILFGEAGRKAELIITI